jgi:hypothetical protein
MNSLFDQSGINLPNNNLVKIVYFVTNDRGERIRMRDAGGKEIVNQFADEMSALESAAKLAASDSKFAPWSRSIYMISKGIVREPKEVAAG